MVSKSSHEISGELAFVHEYLVSLW